MRSMSAVLALAEMWRRELMSEKPKDVPCFERLRTKGLSAEQMGTANKKNKRKVNRSKKWKRKRK